MRTLSPTRSAIPILAYQHESEDVPKAFALHAAYPNPFNPSTTIRFSTPQSARVKLTIIDLLGREVAVLVDDVRTAGEHAVVWQAAAVASGVYLYRMEAESHIESKTLTLVRY